MIDVDETAVMRPCASLRSFTVFVAWHLPGPSSTAAPPAVPPPILPFVKPPEPVKPAERFATSRAAGS